MTPQPNLDWAWEFIETWVRIDIKDPDFVKQAKMDARKEFVTAIANKLESVELEARIDETFNAMTVAEGETAYTKWGKNRRLGFHDGAHSVAGHLRPHLAELKRSQEIILQEVYGTGLQQD